MNSLLKIFLASENTSKNVIPKDRASCSHLFINLESFINACISSQLYIFLSYTLTDQSNLAKGSPLDTLAFGELYIADLSVFWRCYLSGILLEIPIISVMFKPYHLLKSVCHLLRNIPLIHVASPCQKFRGDLSLWTPRVFDFSANIFFFYHFLPYNSDLYVFILSVHGTF